MRGHGKTSLVTASPRKLRSWHIAATVLLALGAPVTHDDRRVCLRLRGMHRATRNQSVKEVGPANIVREDRSKIDVIATLLCHHSANALL